MDQPWWGPLVQWTVWFVLMSLVMGWVARSRSKPLSSSGSQRLVQPASTLIIGVVVFAVFSGMAIGSRLFPDQSATWSTTAIFAGFALFSLIMVAEYFWCHHQLSEEGLSYGRLSGRRGYLKWADLHRVRYAPSMKWFRLETQSGDVARISVMLIGLPEFARVLLSHAPPLAIDSETLPILQATADGRPPSVWI